jgi:nucleoside-diphosphate-sugar epimerase
LVGPPAFGGFDAVIHLAARAGVRHSVENPRVYFETNVRDGLASVAEWYRENREWASEIETR